MKVFKQKKIQKKEKTASTIMLSWAQLWSHYWFAWSCLFYFYFSRIWSQQPSKKFIWSQQPKKKLKCKKKWIFHLICQKCEIFFVKPNSNCGTSIRLEWIMCWQYFTYISNVHFNSFVVHSMVCCFQCSFYIRSHGLFDQSTNFDWKYEA